MLIYREADEMRKSFIVSVAEQAEVIVFFFFFLRGSWGHGMSLGYWLCLGVVLRFLMGIMTLLVSLTENKKIEKRKS